jgi:ABC-type lipoprotein release transport system permease subunit
MILFHRLKSLARWIFCEAIVLFVVLIACVKTYPQTYLVISVLLAAVAMLASYIPARRASAVNPSITLRTE